MFAVSTKRHHDDDLFPDHEEFEREIAKICSRCGKTFSHAWVRIRHEDNCNQRYFSNPIAITLLYQNCF